MTSSWLAETAFMWMFWGGMAGAGERKKEKGEGELAVQVGAGSGEGSRGRQGGGGFPTDNCCSSQKLGSFLVPLLFSSFICLELIRGRTSLGNRIGLLLLLIGSWEAEDKFSLERAAARRRLLQD